MHSGIAVIEIWLLQGETVLTDPAIVRFAGCTPISKGPYEVCNSLGISLQNHMDTLHEVRRDVHGNELYLTDRPFHLMDRHLLSVDRPKYLAPWLVPA